MPTHNRLLSLVLITALLASVFPFTATPSPVEAASEWTVMNSGTTQPLYGVWGTSSYNVYAVGYNGTILRYNGSVWSTVTSGIYEDLLGIWGTSAKDIFVVGGYGTILHFNGTAWSTMSSIATVESYFDAWGTSPNNVYVSGGGGIILHYDGSAWSTMSSPTTSSLRSIWGSSNNDIYAVGDSGTVVHFNGSTWSLVTTGAFDQLQGVYGTSSSDVYAVGANTYVYHYNGSSWSGFQPGSLGLANIWGDSPSNYFAVGWPNKAIWRYDGSTWTHMPSAADSSINLFSNWGACGGDVYAVGSSGAILHYGIGCPPTITSFTRTWGTSGASIVITGTNFTGATAVMFGGTAAASYIVNSPTRITAIVGNGATGNVRITTPAGTAVSATNFNFESSISTAPHGSSVSGITAAAPQGPVSLPSVSVKSASLSATRVAPGTTVNVTADIVNTGTVNGTSSIKVYVNGELENSQGITVNSGGSTPITFTVSRNEPGTYTVYVGGAGAGSFTVDELAGPGPVIIGAGLLFLILLTAAIILFRRNSQYSR